MEDKINNLIKLMSCCLMGYVKPLGKGFELRVISKVICVKRFFFGFFRRYIKGTVLVHNFKKST